MAILRHFGAKWYAQCLCADSQLRHWGWLEILSFSDRYKRLEYNSHPIGNLIYKAWYPQEPHTILNTAPEFFELSRRCTIEAGKGEKRSLDFYTCFTPCIAGVRTCNNILRYKLIPFLMPCPVSEIETDALRPFVENSRIWCGRKIQASCMSRSLIVGVVFTAPFQRLFEVLNWCSGNSRTDFVVSGSGPVFSLSGPDRMYSGSPDGLPGATVQYTF